MVPFDVKAIRNAIKDCDHGGKESVLQCVVALSVGANCPPCCKFSPSLNNHDFNKNTINGVGLELGFFNISAKGANRYIDIADAKVKNPNKDPDSVNWLCEVKVIDPKRYPYKGRWYPYIYGLEICGKRPFDFLTSKPQKKSPWPKIATDADEGQIIFDFIKMMACRQKNIAWKDAALYQILAIKKEGPICNFDSSKAAVRSVLEAWQSHCSINLRETAKIYEWEDFVKGKIQEVAIQCLIDGVTGGVIKDLGDHHGYQHILINWPSAKNADCDFTF